LLRYVSTDASVVSQRTLAHSPAPVYPDAAIGGIGPLSGSEGSALGFVVTASSLGPATTTFTPANLPPGAVFDASAHVFHWVPAPDQSGTWPNVHFEASDGVQTVGEDVTLTVAESRRSVSGRVRRTTGAGVPHALVYLSGAPGGKRPLLTDAN